MAVILKKFKKNPAKKRLPSIRPRRMLGGRFFPGIFGSQKKFNDLLLHVAEKCRGAPRDLIPARVFEIVCGKFTDKKTDYHGGHKVITFKRKATEVMDAGNVAKGFYCNDTAIVCSAILRRMGFKAKTVIWHDADGFQAGTIVRVKNSWQHIRESGLIPLKEHLDEYEADAYTIGKTFPSIGIRTISDYYAATENPYDFMDGFRRVTRALAGAGEK